MVPTLHIFLPTPAHDGAAEMGRLEAASDGGLVHSGQTPGTVVLDSSGRLKATTGVKGTGTRKELGKHSDGGSTEVDQAPGRAHPTG